MLRRNFLAAGALLGAGSVAGSVLSRPALAQSAGAQVLKFVPQADLAITDPLRSTAYVTRNHGYLVFDTLYGTDENFKVTPQMVEGHVVEDDGKLWKLTLRPGLKFHDNTPVLARDVVASVKRWGAVDGFGQMLLASTAELSAPSDRVVQFRLKKPFPLLPDALAKLSGYMPCIMPERLANTDPTKAVTEMVGSGPYRFVASERVQGSRFVYEKFAGYVPNPSAKASRTAGGKVAHVPRIEWQILPDAATAAAALQAGEVDWIETPSLDLLPMLHRSRDVVISLKDATGNIGVLRLNHLTKPFDNPAIRQVVLHAVRQADFMTAVAGTGKDAWRDGVGYFCPGTPLAEGLKPIATAASIAASKKALQEAGYKGEPVVLLAATDFPTINAMASVGGDLLRQIGMNVDYQAVDWGTVQQRRLSKQPVGEGGWGGYFTYLSGTDVFNPAVNLLLRANGANAGPGWPESAALETYRAQWFEAPDLTAQRAACALLQQEAEKVVPYVPLGQFFQPAAYRKNISGILPGFSTFYNVVKS